MMVMPDVDGRLLALLDCYQHGFPVVARPFFALAQQAGCDEATLLASLQLAQQGGLLSRIGPVFAPNTVGASTLAALAVPPAQLDEVAALVSRQPEVNHNYAREHRYNLWFVLTATGRAGIDAALARIRESSGLEPLDLPLECEYHIDLGFSLAANTQPKRPLRVPEVPQLDALDRALIAALAAGLPLLPQPFAPLAVACGLTEHEVLLRVQGWVDSGVIRRFGFVLRHHELGYRANAMCVWQVPDGERDAIGRLLAADQDVTLCYARPARGEHWPYNLFCMIHAKNADAAQCAAQRLAATHGLGHVPQAVLISTRRYTQRGARY